MKLEVRVPASLFSLPQSVPISPTILPGERWSPDSDNRAKRSANQGPSFLCRQDITTRVNSSLNRQMSDPEAKPPAPPDHAHVPGPFHPEDTVLSPIPVPTGRPCLGTRSSPHRDLSALLKEVSRPADRPLV